MKRFVILASVVVLAAGSANCGGSGSSSEWPSSIVGPSAVGDASPMLSAKGGGGKPGGGTTGGGTLSIKMPLVDDTNSDGVPSFRDTLTFNVQTTATVYPYVTLRCYQNGVLVSKESNGMFPTSLGQNFTLGPTASWTGGTANCTATLENWDAYSKNGNITPLASISFSTN